MELSKLCFIWILFGVSLAATNQMRRLVRSLVDKYDNLCLPQVEDNSPLNVSHSFQLRRIISLEKQVLTLDAYISIYWQDDQLVWDPDDFGGINMTRIPSDIVWKPDIMLKDNAEPFSGVHTSDINIVVLFDGTVFYTLPVKTQSYCNTDHSKLKKKGHVKCSLKFMSWTHDGQSINLANADESQILIDFDKTFNKEWKLVNHGVNRNVQIYDCCPEPYIDIEYHFKLEKL